MRLELENVSKSFGPHRALTDISLRVEDARSLALIGPSGGGKSTLLRILGGLETPDAGRVVVNDKPLDFEERKIAGYRRTVGTVFQAYNLFPHLTALENITLPLEKVHRYSRTDAIKAAREQLSRLRLETHADKKPAELSGGQRQRVAIARALSIQPQLLLFDEPTSALDPEMTAEVLEVIEDLCAEGRDLMVVTHHMAFARRIADRVALVADGCIVESGASEAFFASAVHPVTRGFLSKVLKY